MKKYIFLVPLLFTLVACGQNPCNIQEDINSLINKKDSYSNQVSHYKTQKEALVNEVEKLKNNADVYNHISEGGEVEYFLEIEVKQSHFTLDLGVHLKDEMNAFNFHVPVSKQYYDTVNVGDKLAEEFRSGSFILYGSIGDWNLTIINKVYNKK